MTELTLDASSVEKRPIYQKILVMLSIMTTVSGSLTLLMTYLNKGFSQTFFFDWGSSYLIAMFVMAPTGITAMFLFSRAIDSLIPNAADLIKKLITGLLMALVMESVMSATTTANNIGFSDSTVYFDAWLHGFLGSLPLGLVIAMSMTFLVKPRLEKFMHS